MTRIPFFSLLWTLVLAAAACAADPVDEPPPAPDVAADVPVEAAPPSGPGTFTERGLVEVRAIVHLHSAYSHDACDDEGLDADGVPNATCVARLKAALCAERIGVAFLTDHPSFMREQPFQDLLHADTEAGDVILFGPDGEATSAALACPPGQGGPDGTVKLTVGFEGSHTMPLGLTRHLADEALYGVSFEITTDPADLDALTAAVRSAGGLTTIAHSEQADIDVATLVAHDVSAMEIFNFHANFNVVFASGDFDKILQMDPFLDPGPSGPPSDLVALLMLDSYPEAALNKWRAVVSARPITGLVGSDVHENVVLPGLCFEDLCEGLAEDYPHMVEALSTEGPLILRDGDRLDSYARLFRWMQNRVWIDPTDDTLPGAMAALEAGRTISVFEVFGDARGTSLVAEVDGALVDMGGEVDVGAGAVLWARSPDGPVPNHGATWTDGSDATMTSHLLRLEGDAFTVVTAWTEPSTWVSVPLDTPGAYHLEVTVEPRHLAAVLGPVGHLANQTYRWVETNAIRATGPDQGE